MSPPVGIRTPWRKRKSHDMVLATQSVRKRGRFRACAIAIDRALL